MANRDKKFILWFNEIGITDIPLVGGKNASLGEMYQRLYKKGVKIPNGFAITAYAYHYFLKKAGIKDAIRDVFEKLDIKNIDNLSRQGDRARELILRSTLPKELEDAIITAYEKMEKIYGNDCDVAVRSSATAEDLPDASFAGQQETYLNIRGKYTLIDTCRRCFASIFTARAISYREEKKFDHFSIGLSIGVQKMVRSDLGSSGVMFSIDTESGFQNAVLINAAYGLGENVVQGAVNPDEFYVFKPTLKKGFKPILNKKLGEKKIKMIYNHKIINPVRNINVTINDRQKFCISDEEVLQLARWAIIIEEHYKRPMDIEWAKDGKSGELFIVQARPETVQSQRDVSFLEDYKLKTRGEIICKGNPVGSKIGSGPAHVIADVDEINQFKEGEVLVTDMTDPDWVPVMKRASAIVTNRGGRTCHAAIVSRELGIPCLVGTNDGTTKIKTKQNITVSCAEGEVGFVYDGKLDFEVKKVNIKNIKRPKTKIMMNIGSPDQAFSSSFIPNDGVGLAREEFVISSYIKIHPLALIHFNKLKNDKIKEEISRLTIGYKDKKQYFIDKLSQGVSMIAAAFYPKDVIVRLSDFKTDEYANLIGGQEFEPKEDNPMLGWRGASRYYSEKYRPAFELECKALRKVRDEMGLTNLKVMVPFCRTVEEGEKVLEIMKQNGLVRGKNGLEVYVMCEIPSNVILAKDFAKIFDGFSIGSNDLTQLTLGVDRNSELVSHIYNERNEAVKSLISQVIKEAKRLKRKIGICGQGPSDFPDFAEFLVKEKIDSISLNPDTVIKTTLDILEVEKKMKP
ncbi:MAG: phosphoenolpyruvate synthase [bacterium]